MSSEKLLRFKKAAGYCNVEKHHCRLGRNGLQSGLGYLCKIYIANGGFREDIARLPHEAFKDDVYNLMMFLLLLCVSFSRVGYSSCSWYCRHQYQWKRVVLSALLSHAASKSGHLD